MVPENFHVRREAGPPLSCPCEQPLHVDQDGLVFPGGKTQIRARCPEPARRIRDLERETARRRVRPLAERNIDRTVGGMNPAVRNEP
jgi:hypothetical protein